VVIGAFQVRFRVIGARSLKEKRKILKSLKDRISRMNVSIAEVDDQDKWQAATLGVAIVSNDSAYINAVMDKLRVFLLDFPGMEVLQIETEIIHV